MEKPNLKLLVTTFDDVEWESLHVPKPMIKLKNNNYSFVNNAMLTLAKGKGCIDGKLLLSEGNQAGENCNPIFQIVSEGEMYGCIIGAEFSKGKWTKPLAIVTAGRVITFHLSYLYWAQLMIKQDLPTLDILKGQAFSKQLANQLGRIVGSQMKI